MEKPPAEAGKPADASASGRWRPSWELEHKIRAIGASGVVRDGVLDDLNELLRSISEEGGG